MDFYILGLTNSPLRTMTKIETEIHQKTFKNENLKAHVNILFTASWLESQLSILLKEKHNLSTQQFNILRILRGSHPTPTSIKGLTSRMIDKNSNASRLVDKLERKGFAERTSSEIDRRRVDVVITAAGLDCLGLASIAVDDKIDELFKSLDLEKAKILNQCLDQLRS